MLLLSVAVGVADLFCFCLQWLFFEGGNVLKVSRVSENETTTTSCVVTHPPPSCAAFVRLECKRLLSSLLPSFQIG